jgi:perosamine synthetase
MKLAPVPTTSRRLVDGLIARRSAATTGVESMPRITAFPQPQLGAYFSRSHPLAATLQSYASLHSSGRAAIYWAFRGMNPHPGSRAWIPAYHCGAEAQAVADAGWEPGYYRIRRDLTIDLDDLEAKLHISPGPVLVIHYFGVGQPFTASVGRMCGQHAVPWVEDCAHALFSKHQGRDLGSFAPIAVFSLRKTLPLLDGGALQKNAEKAAGPEHFQRPPRGRFSLRPHRAYLREALLQTGGRWTVALYQRLRGIEIPEPVEWEEALQERERYPDRISAISYRLAQASDPEEVIRRRRRNWMALDNYLSHSPGYCKVFESLSAETCPLFLVIRVAQRQRMVDAMLEKRIEPFVFGAFRNRGVDQNEFPEDASMRSNLLCLPVHQQLGAVEMERIATAVRPLLAAYGCR